MAITIYTPKNRAHAIEAAYHSRAPLSFPEDYTLNKTLDDTEDMIMLMAVGMSSFNIERVSDGCEDEDVVEATLRSPYDDGYSYTGKFKTRILGNRYELEDGRVFVAKPSGFEELTA